MARSGDGEAALPGNFEGGWIVFLLAGSRRSRSLGGAANRRFLERLAAFGRLDMGDSPRTGLFDVSVEAPSSRRARRD